MPSKPRVRTWLNWSVFAFALTVLGFALDASLPSEPRFVLRGPHQIGKLSANGAMLTSGTVEPDANGNLACMSLKAWDTFAGLERGEFFRGLIGVHEVAITGGIVGGRGADPDGRGFDWGSVEYSPDRRYGALLHRDGMALADLQTGREWPTAVKIKIVAYACEESAAIYRLLQQPIATKPLHEKTKVRVALEYFSDAFDGKLPILVDKEAFAQELGPDAPDPYEEEVCLPEVPSKIAMRQALWLVLSQIGKGTADFVIRRNFIEITTAKRAGQVWPPIFSPRGMFVILADATSKEAKLHVVRCESGQLIASLHVHPGAITDFGFTPDEEWLYFVASEKQQPLLSVWNTRTKQIVSTFPAVTLPDGTIAQHLLAPDGHTLLVNTEGLGGGGVDLLDLRNGTRRRLIDFAAHPAGIKAKVESRCRFAFSPDNQTLVRLTEKELQFWDVSTGKMREAIKIDPPEGEWRNLAISEDSRICMASDSRGSVSAWDLGSGNRVMHGDAPGFDLLERRFLFDLYEHRIDLLHPADGKRLSVSPGGNATPCDAVITKADRPSMLSVWTNVKQERGFPMKWFCELMRIEETRGCCLVTDLTTGRNQLRVDLGLFALTHPDLSDNGRTLATSEGDSIIVWDVPGKPPRLLVFGIPLALAGATGFARIWIRRKRGTPQTIPASK